MFSQYLSGSYSIFTYSLTTIVLFSTIMISSSMAQTPKNQSIRGMSDGKNNSGDCGYVGDKPNHVLNLSQQTYSLNLILEATAGKPSLLILGPSSGDRFCVLGEPKKGKKAKMGGVWAPGRYLIYIGDSQGGKNPFTLKIVNK